MPAATTDGPPVTRTTARTPAPHRPGPGVLRAALAVVLLLLLGLTGCSSDQTSSAGEPAADGAVGAEAPAGQAGAGGAEDGGDAVGSDGGDGGGDGGGSGDVGAEAPAGVDGEASDGIGGGVLPGTAAAGRQVVTSSIDVAVQDVPAAAEQVRALAVRAGGGVAGEASSGGDRPRAEIVLRVPTGATLEVMAQVSLLGEEMARTAESEPVETRLVDLESRTATQRVGVERIRALLQDATTLEDILALEAELGRRQADLESLDAQRAALADLASLATVTVRLTTPEDVAGPEAEQPAFLVGLRGGWEALGASTALVLVAVGALLPFAVVAGAVLAVVVVVVRTVRRGRPEPRPQPVAPPRPAPHPQPPA